MSRRWALCERVDIPDINDPNKTVMTLGQPSQIAHLLKSWVPILKAEPDETFGDRDVRQAASALTDLLNARLEGLPCPDE